MVSDGFGQHFKKFVEGLSERGVDTKKVRIVRAEVILWWCVGSIRPRHRKLAG
ncbi:hypothetical protein HYDPIDRAFT_106746 [Hydnomerulius pinastri MD-312]|nr:hypothetical protein HYDPIDRAFT_106746 [Hydnomerulius pinastri MD-312]